MKNLHKCGFFLRGLAAGMAVLSCTGVAKAIPFASCITNSSGTISFYMNAPGANVTVVYEDGTTNVNYDGVTAGTNLSSGVHTFALGAHTGYSISSSITGSGVTMAVLTNSIGGGRGLACNVNPASTNFGRVYFAVSVNGSGSKPMAHERGLVAGHLARCKPVGRPLTGTGTGQTPDWVSVAPDSSVLVV